MNLTNVYDAPFLATDELLVIHMLPYRDSRFIRILIGILLVLFVAYALYEGRGLFYGPTIDVPDATVTVYDATTIVRGHTERITELLLNGKTIPVTEEGDFAETLILAPGSNYLVLEARDARGRKTQKVVHVVFVTTGGAASPSQTPSLD